MSAIFLNTTEPDFDSKEKELVEPRNGIPAKYRQVKPTRSSAKNIEDAFALQLFMEEIPKRGLTTPNEIDRLYEEIKQIAPHELYNIGTNGKPYLRWHMYEPTAKYRKELENAVMNQNVAGEDFAPNNYAKTLGKIEKAILKPIEPYIKRVNKLFESVRLLNKDSSGSSITKAINDVVKAKKDGFEILSTLINPAFIEEREKVRNALGECNLMAIHLENVKRQFNAPFNELTNMLSRTRFTSNNDNFIENIIDLFRRIMNEYNALRLGTVLKNLPPNEFDSIRMQYQTVAPELLNKFIEDLANHLNSRRGGKKTYKKHKKQKTLKKR